MMLACTAVGASEGAMQAPAIMMSAVISAVVVSGNDWLAPNCTMKASVNRLNDKVVTQLVLLSSTWRF